MNKQLLRKDGLWPKKKRRWLGVRWLFLFVLIMESVCNIQADEINDPKNYTIENHQAEGYVTFTVPFFNSKNNNDAVKDGSGIYVTVDGQSKQIIRYYSKTSEWRRRNN